MNPFELNIIDDTFKTDEAEIELRKDDKKYKTYEVKRVYLSDKKYISYMKNGMITYNKILRNNIIYSYIK